MPSTLDSVRPIGVETPVEGGTQTRTNACEMDPTQDAVAVAGVHLVGPGVSPTDKTVYVDRTAGGLRLTDAATQRLLSELITSVSGGVNEHGGLRDLSHFLGGEGPGPGFGGGYLVRNLSGPLVTSEIWYTSSNLATKIISRAYAYPAGSPLPSSCLWTIYSATGAPLKTCSDVYGYSGPILTSTMRTFANAS